MSNLLHKEIYPSLFEKAPGVLPEFQFKSTQQGWVATAKLDIDGSATRAGGKVYWYADNPQSLWSQKQQQAISLWDYIASRDGLNPQDSKRVLKHLATMSGITLQAPAQGGGVSSTFKKKGIPPSLLRDALPWLQRQLWSNPEAEDVREYLLSTRGYTEEDCRAMGLGFMGDRQLLASHLTAKGHTDRQIAFFLQLDKSADAVPSASTHRLVIPVHGDGQRLEGLSYRATAPEAEPKYRNSYGLAKDAALLDFPRGTPQLVLVEGHFDARLAKARGLHHVVAMHSNRLGVVQLERLKANGIRALTLCLDNDRGGASGRKSMLKTLTDHQLPLQVYIARLPAGVKDPDELIVKQGIAAFREILNQAQGMGGYIGTALAAQYRKTTTCTPQERAQLLHRCATVESKLLFPVDRADFRQALQPALDIFQLSSSLYEQSITTMMQLGLEQGR